MKARTAWLLGLGAAVVAALRLFRRTPAPAVPPEPPGVDPRAEQLREKLAESRAAVEEMERERTQEPEPQPDEPETFEPDTAEGVEERRKRVHERGQAAARRMRRPPDPPSQD